MKMLVDFTTSRSLLNSLRVLAVVAFVCVTVAMLFPRTQRLLVGGCVSLTGMLALQLFRLKSVEQKPDAPDEDAAGVRLNP